MKKLATLSLLFISLYSTSLLAQWYPYPSYPAPSRSEKASYDKNTNTCNTYRKNVIGECGNYPRMIHDSIDWYISNYGRQHNVSYLFDIKNIDGGKFSGSELPGIELDFISMMGVDLSSSDLEGAKLNNSTCHKANFKKANLTDGNLNFVKCREANFENISGSGIQFVAAKLDRSSFVNADIPDADFGGDTSAKYANFTGANLEGAELMNNFMYANFKGANLKSARLIGGNFTKADFTGADLRGANLDGATFTDAIFYKTKFDAAHMNAAVLIGADARCADFGRAYRHEHSYTTDLQSDECTRWPNRTRRGMPTSD